MKRTSEARQRLLTLTWLSFAVGATARTLTTLGSYVRGEMRRRGYPSWEQCHCDFKAKETIFQVWHSQHEQRGETIFAEEWGLQLTKPPQWLRRLLHPTSQPTPTPNPRG